MNQDGDTVGLFAFHINHVISKCRRFSRRGGLRYWFNNSSSDMGCGKDLAEGEKVLVMKEITKVRTNKSIAERINRCVMTEIRESVRIFGKSFKEGTSV